MVIAQRAKNPPIDLVVICWLSVVNCPLSVVIKAQGYPQITGIIYPQITQINADFLFRLEIVDRSFVFKRFAFKFN